MKRNITAFVILFQCLLFIACSSPEEDGRRAAEKYNNFQREYAKDIISTYNSYIDGFASSPFESRIIARENLNAQIAKVDQEMERRTQEALAYKGKLESRYRTHRRDATEFQYAYDAQLSPSNPNNSSIASLQHKANMMIQTIIPQKPDLEKLKRDLVGRKISEGVDGYRKENWCWEVKSVDELKNVEILEDIKDGEDYIYNVHLVLQGENSDYDATIRIHYVLRQYDDWTIEVIDTRNMQIVQTHRYDNCISTRLWGMLGEHRYEFTNSCDIQLLIGGVVFSEIYERWEKFTVVVDANSKATVGDMIQNRINDYKIHFIERP